MGRRRSAFVVFVIVIVVEVHVPLVDPVSCLVGTVVMIQDCNEHQSTIHSVMLFLRGSELERYFPRVIDYAYLGSPVSGPLVVLEFMVSCFVEMCALWVRIGGSGLVKGLVMGIWKGDPRVCGADRK